MAVLKINGVEMPAPSSMKIAVFDVSAGGERSADGSLVADKIAVKRRLTLGWAYLSPEDMAALLSAAQQDAFFTAEFPDPGTGQPGSMRCCLGDRSAGVLRMDGGRPLWTKVEMIFTEV